MAALFQQILVVFQCQWPFQLDESIIYDFLDLLKIHKELCSISLEYENKKMGLEERDYYLSGEIF